jgi:hypothetical protein
MEIGRFPKLHTDRQERVGALLPSSHSLILDSLFFQYTHMFSKKKQEGVAEPSPNHN